MPRLMNINNDYVYIVTLLIFILIFIIGRPCPGECEVLSAMSRLVEGIFCASYFPGEYRLGSRSHLSKSTNLSIVNRAEEWVVRLDIPHEGTRYPHININRDITGLPDPHIKIPRKLVVIGRGLNTVAIYAYEYIWFVAIVAEYMRFYFSKHEERSSKTFALVIILFGYVGGLAGVYLGSLICRETRHFFSGVHSILAAATGSIFGTYVGGIVGSVLISSIICSMC